MFLLIAAGGLTAITLATYLARSSLSFKRTLGLLGLRLGALLLIFLLIWRPALATYDDDAIVPSRIFILLDSSESMAVTDEGVSRWQKARDVIEGSSVVEALQKLARDKKIEAKFYHGGIEVRPLDAAAAPTAKRTEIGHWLYDLREAKRGSNILRGVVVLSDGIDNGKRLSLDEAAKYRGICKVYTLGLGRHTTTSSRRDIALVDIRAEPSPVPVKGKLTVKGTINAPSFINALVDVDLFIQYPDGTEKKVASRPKVPLLKAKDNEVIITCDAPDKPGEIKVKMKVGMLEGDINAANNEIVTYVSVIKGGVTILWVEGTHRHESAFAIRYALAKDPRFPVFYGIKPREAKPGPEIDDFFDFDKRHYDVIVIGDITSKRFSGGNDKVLERISKLVEGGTGLLLMGGFETFNSKESDWARSKLAALFPTDMDPFDRVGSGHIETAIKVEPTDFAKKYLLRLADNADDNEKLWNNMSPLVGASRIGKLRPGATLLATAITAEGKEPLMATTTIGKGRVIAFGADTTHQSWIIDRKGKSTLKEYQRFWKQLMLWLAHQEDSESNLHIKLLPESRRVDAGQGEMVEVAAELRGKDGNPLKDAAFTAKVISPTKEEFDVDLRKEGPGVKGSFFKASEPGEWVVKVTGKGSDGKDKIEKTGSARFMVYADDLETMKVAANPDFLDKLARASGGKSYPADEAKLVHILEEIAAEKDAPSRPKVEYWPHWNRQPASESFGDQWEALWSTPTLICMLLFVALISAEWVLRRKWGMV